jgi:hypothetical protein
LDGWTDISGNSVYAIMLKKGSDKFFLNTLELLHERHTSDNIFTALDKSVTDSGVDWTQIIAVTTDSPSVMKKLRETIQKNHRHVVGIPCALHVLNLLAKDIAEHDFMKDVVKDCQRLVAFFTKSSFWNEEIQAFQKRENLPHGLSTFCKTRWFSLIKVSFLFTFLHIDSEYFGRFCWASSTMKKGLNLVFGNLETRIKILLTFLKLYVTL